MDGGPGLIGCVVLVTTSRAQGEGLARACTRSGLAATVTEPRGGLPPDADALVLDLTTSAATVVAFAARVASPDIRVVAVADGAGVDESIAPTGDLVDAWVDARQSFGHLLAAIRGRTGGARPSEERDRSAGELLTTRERQVLQELLVGDGTPSMAARLGISEHTVRKHVQNVLTKLGVRSRAEAAAWALGQGLAPAESAEGVGQ